VRSRKQRMACGQGKLPDTAYLANPFVPFQQEDPPKYEPRKGLIRGTIYPGLDLPFKGMVNKNEKPRTPMTELQTLAFVIQELALYLDTHPTDRNALEMYQAYQEKYHELKAEYTNRVGPLNHRTPSKGPYRWLDDPWPWEYAKNKEG